MRRGRDAFVVLAGYALALACALVAARVYDAELTRRAVSDGMAAFGTAMFFGAVFLGLSLVPTGYALWRLRASVRFWNVVLAAGIGVAITGAAGALEWVRAMGAAPQAGAWLFVTTAAIVRVLAAPLVAAFFALAAFLAPELRQRRTFAALALLDLVIGGLVLFVLVSGLARR